MICTSLLLARPSLFTMHTLPQGHFVIAIVVILFNFLLMLLFGRSIELSAQHDAKRVEQEARGQLERQALLNEKVVCCSD